MEKQTIQWPDHYSAADVALIGRIKAWIDSHDYTQAALARLARIGASSLNQILKGTYATNPSKLLAAVDSAMVHAEEKTGNVTPVETSVFKLAYAACSMARRYRNFAVLTGYVGTGKTYAIKRYAATHPNTHLIEATPTMTPQSLVRLLAGVVAGYEGKGSIDDKFRSVVAALKDTDSLLIVDEAETLTPHQLHTLRRLRDLSNVGIVLCGTEHLSGLIKPLHGQFDQIRSRTGFWPDTVRGINADDAAALVQAGFGAEEVPDEVVDRLYQYCKGSARMLVEGLVAGIREFRRGRPLDVKLVDAVAKQALCLQSLS
ncbi:DNA transposition protein [Burkholderia metallica]|uniref:AAA family ATPase n=1 Tax=Burkholderia metallica TaxID=488729 RepID=UPI00157B23A9|nr:AAA family ATPase [Burkholderia metallica]NTZ82380.1 DNA transposition protein [Burkholderia metallica]